jgi:hypothetical protein
VSNDSTVNRELLFLAAACRHAKCGTFFDGLDRKSRAGIYAKEDPGQPERLSNDDVAAIAANLPATYRPPTWLALLTGMQQQEILGLTWVEVRATVPDPCPTRGRGSCILSIGPAGRWPKDPSGPRPNPISRSRPERLMFEHFRGWPGGCNVLTQETLGDLTLDVRFTFKDP